MSEPGVDQLISVPQAIAILDAVSVRPRIIEIALRQARGLILATDIHLDRDDPPFDKSLLDGFAVRAAETVAAPVTLSVVATVAAGGAAAAGLQPGQAMAIMTGAPLPAGADAVVPIELTTITANLVHLAAPVKSGNGISRRGSDAAINTIVLSRGTRLGPAQIAVAASAGMDRLSVFAPPKVAVLCTGDELVPAGQKPIGSQIRNTNAPMMLALLGQLGCETVDLGTAVDEPAIILQALKSGLAFDALFVVGGMSMGQRDHVPRLLVELGLTLKISKLKLKPGKPFVFATDGRRLVFGLPGNPVSAFVCTLRLASRVLKKIAGDGLADGLTTAALETPLPANGPREFCQPAIHRAGTVHPLNWKGSADIYTLARANALIIRPENAPPAPAGQHVPILIF